MPTLSIPQYRETGIKDIYDGVTTVWLLSTLGGPSRLNSIGTGSANSTIKKKDIINLSIPKTCEVIQKNGLDLPLRQVSNLLYGVTVCYNRQTEYVLNDINGLLVQLQRKMYWGSQLQKRRINERHNQLATILDLRKNNETAKALLDDDPTFDIDQTNRFEDIFKIASDHEPLESITIRRQDYLNELTNSNHIDKSEFLGNINDPNMSMTLEDVPVDFDFNFDLDEVVSRQGTAAGSSTGSIDSSHDINVFHNDREFSLSFGPESSVPEGHESIADHTGIDLEIPDNLQEKDGEEEILDPIEPLQKKLKLDRTQEYCYFKEIIIDNRICLSTDSLRNNNEHYCEIMDAYRNPKKKTSIIEKKMLLFNNNGEIFMNCWSTVFNRYHSQDDTDSLQFLSDNTSIERGRKFFKSNPSSRASSDISSEEQGRRAVSISERFSDNNSDLPLNLEQIVEELDETSSQVSFPPAMEQGPLRIDLGLPSSSFGRIQTASGTPSDHRNSSSNLNYDRDVVDELRRKTYGVNTVNVPEKSALTQFSITPQIVLDSQTKRFYDYIKNRSSIIGKRTNQSPMFSKKLLFEDIVPGRLSQVEGDESSVIVEKKIAANAFLSLLNLASRNLIAIKEYKETSNKQASCPVMGGDDIIIYI